MNNETTAVPSDEVAVEESWPGEWRASFKDYDGRWTNLIYPYRSRSRALRAAQIAWLEDHVP